MKRRILIGLLVSLSLVLSGCGGKNNNEAFSGLILPSENYTFFETSDFIFQYPRDWDVKSRSQVDAQFSDTVRAVFTSNFKDPFFTPVLTVEGIAVTEGVGNPAFADQMIRKNEAVLIDYTEIERLTVPSLVGDSAVTTSLIRFSGKEKLQNDTLEFVQVYLAKGSVGFVVSGAYDPGSDTNEAEKIINSLQTFRLK